MNRRDRRTACSRTLVWLFLTLCLTIPIWPQSDGSVQSSWLAPTSDGRLPTLPALDESVPSPADVLGVPLGSRFHHHHQLLDYLEVLADASPRVSLEPYGTTYEGRPLTLAIISSSSNIARLDSIRADRQLLADPSTLEPNERKALTDRAPAVLWLGYGVHGNESSSAEAALATAYVLAAQRDSDALDNVVVLIDPLMNPDGRERYVQGYRSRRGATPNPDPLSAEHREPWPGGRGNHYGLDLNRDWAWATQTETRHRLVAFRAWEPQVTVDLHEMAASSTYFFPPSAEPVHPRIREKARHWLELFGRGNAKAFDAIGWTYYVADRFDLFYPGYGDSYPTLRDGIGMTYEVGGGGRAGAAINLTDGRVKSLADRVVRHLTSSLTTVATTMANSHPLVEEFAATRARNAASSPTTYVWSANAPEADGLAELLDRHGIRVQRTTEGIEVEGMSISEPLPSRPSKSIELAPGDYVVATNQPLGPLAAALLERDAKIGDSFLSAQRQRVLDDREAEFYDITAWSLPMAFNLPAWRIDGKIPDQRLIAFGFDQPPPVPSTTKASSAIGFIAPPDGIDGYRFAIELWRRQIRFRRTSEPFILDGKDFPAGSLIIAAEDHTLDAWSQLRGDLPRIAAEFSVTLEPTESAWTTHGVDLGSDRFPASAASRIGLVRGSGISPSSFGALWHLLDQSLHASHSLLEISELTDLLSGFDTIVVPDSWQLELSESTGTALSSWVDRGGVLIAIGRSAEYVGQRGLGAESQSQQTGSDPETPEDTAADEPIGATLTVPGALVAATYAKHPINHGLLSDPVWLYIGDAGRSAFESTSTVVAHVLDEQPRLAGFAWPEGDEHLPGTPLVSVERSGDGYLVLFYQDPAFRLFTRGTMPILLNALFFSDTW